jgi:menaquinone-dependent protoporphyrinogen IX oxidase
MDFLLIQEPLPMQHHTPTRQKFLVPEVLAHHDIAVYFLFFIFRKKKKKKKTKVRRRRVVHTDHFSRATRNFLGCWLTIGTFFDFWLAIDRFSLSWSVVSPFRFLSNSAH